jgi:hypothetical protein
MRKILLATVLLVAGAYQAEAQSQPAVGANGKPAARSKSTTTKPPTSPVKPTTTATTATKPTTAATTATKPTTTTTKTTTTPAAKPPVVAKPAKPAEPAMVVRKF